MFRTLWVGVGGYTVPRKWRGRKNLVLFLRTAVRGYSPISAKLKL